MAGVTDDAAPARAADAAPTDLGHVTAVAVCLVAGAVLVVGARAGAVELLLAVALMQALSALSWVLACGMSGRAGALVVAGVAATGSDICVSVWPHSRLGTLLVIVALATPLMFVHQLSRGAARVRIVESLTSTAVLVVTVTGLAAFVQLRHEFVPAQAGGRVVAAVVAAAAGALIVGHLVDVIMPVPRFDAEVPRGLLAVVASAGLGGSVGHLALGDGTQFTGTRGTFVGAALGALVGLFAVAAAFIEHSAPLPPGARDRRLRPVAATLLTLSLTAPVAFLLCLAIRA